MALNLSAKAGSLERLKVLIRWGCSSYFAQIRCTAPCEISTALAIARPVQWVTSPGGSLQVSATTLSSIPPAKAGLPGGRVRSFSKPATPSSANRCRQRQTEGRLTPDRIGNRRHRPTIRRQQNDPRPLDMFVPPISIGQRSPPNEHDHRRKAKRQLSGPWQRHSMTGTPNEKTLG